MTDSNGIYRTIWWAVCEDEGKGRISEDSWVSGLNN